MFTRTSRGFHLNSMQTATNTFFLFLSYSPLLCNPVIEKVDVIHNLQNDTPEAFRERLVKDDRFVYEL